MYVPSQETNNWNILLFKYANPIHASKTLVVLVNIDSISHVYSMPVTFQRSLKQEKNMEKTLLYPKAWTNSVLWRDGVALWALTWLGMCGETPVVWCLHLFQTVPNYYSAWANNLLDASFCTITFLAAMVVGMPYMDMPKAGTALIAGNMGVGVVWPCLFKGPAVGGGMGKGHDNGIVTY